VEGVVLPKVWGDREHVFHLYVVRVARRDEAVARLNAQGIGAGIHYPVPAHLAPAFAGLGYGAGSFPVAERLAGEVLSLPMYAELSLAQVERVVAALKGALG
jgi:dTDP-4-amino-4,6-dideoxygalactose transaminase